MRSFAIVPFITLALGLFASAAPADPCDSELCRHKANSVNPTIAADATLGLFERNPRLTNGQRLARGLPLLPPRHIRGSPTRKSVNSAVPPVNYRARINVLDSTTGASLGYISEDALNQAQYAYGTIDDALIVDFTLNNGDTSASGINLITENSNIPNYVNLGLVQGRDDTDSDLNSGSYQYVYIANTNPTPANSPPQTVGNSYTQATGLSRTSESAVWTVDTVTNDLSVVWINSDGNNAPIVLFAQSTALYGSGDPAQFNARYPAPITLVTLKIEII